MPWLTLLTLAVGLALAPAIDRLALRPEDRPLTALVADLRRAWLVGLIGCLGLALGPLRALVDLRQQRGYRGTDPPPAVQGLLITGLSLLGAWAGWGITGQARAVAVGAPCRPRWCWPGSACGAARACWPRCGRPGPTRRPAVRCGPQRPPSGAEPQRPPRPADRRHRGRTAAGPGVLAALFVTQRLAALCRPSCRASGAASWAGLAESHAQGRTDVFNRRLVELTRLVAVLGVAAPCLSSPTIAASSSSGCWPGWARRATAATPSRPSRRRTCWAPAVVSLWNWCFSAPGRSTASPGRRPSARRSTWRPAWP